MELDGIIEGSEGAASSEHAQFLTFSLASQNYALDVLDVREIRSWSSPTPLPHAAPEVLGVMNLRGAIIPVVDLRRQLSVGDPEFTSTTGVVVVQTELNDKPRQMGLVVDRVLNVTRLDKIGEDAGESDVTNVARRYVLSLRRSDNELVILLNLTELMDAVLGDDESLSNEELVS